MIASFANFPPQEGETWVNIHTNKEASVFLVEEKKVHIRMAGQEKVCQLDMFLCDWKRVSKTSSWFLNVGEELKEKPEKKKVATKKSVTKKPKKKKK